MFKEKVHQLVPFVVSGSNRKYMRLLSENQTAIGTYNPNREENESFLYLSGVFRNKNLNVPEIYAYDPDNDIYLQEDLGEETLYSLLNDIYDEEKKETITGYYKEVIRQLVKFQVLTPEEIDFSKCYPVPEFNKLAIQWDLNYFKYYFLRIFGIHFNEQSLEDDFTRFQDLLIEADIEFFMYRDFQARNIMIKDERPYFIDYQGGRKGPLYYDLASLLFQAKADLPVAFRNALLDLYLTELEKYRKVNREEFLRHYYHFVYLRLFQVMGAYGFRGKIEKKPHFIQSIPFAINNLKWLLNNKPLPSGLKEIEKILPQIVEININRASEKAKRLTVLISSFSFKRGIPDDYSGNGGGFVFDCRALPNPGRIEKYRSFTGLDQEIIDYLINKNEVEAFNNKVASIVMQSIDNYKSRDFVNLMVSFGCTGGQHRSVYCAEKLKERLTGDDDLTIIVQHTQIP